MRKILFTAAAALAMLGIGAAPALASNSPNPHAADNSHFTSVYTEGTLSSGNVTWTCAGERIDNNGQGATEQETCKLSGPGTAAYTPGDYGNPSGVFGPFPGYPPSFSFFWFSDFNGQVATTWSLKINGASNTAHLTATYTD